MSLFSIKEYRALMSLKIEQNHGVRGYQSRLSKAAGVHSSHLSRVLNSHVQLTLDQAANLTEFWRLNPDEADYFLDLVLLERSSSVALRGRIERRLAAMRAKHAGLSRRISQAKSLPSSNQGVYYSVWYLSAIHILMTVPKFRTPKAIAERLRLPLPLVQASLAQLKELGLATFAQSQWEPAQTDLHLPESELWARIHHCSWRQKSALKIQEFDPEAQHYSGVHSLSVEDAMRLRQLLVEFLQSSRKLMAPSPEEELFFLGCDFYRV